jgi:hypothetical protein
MGFKHAGRVNLLTALTGEGCRPVGRARAGAACYRACYLSFEGCVRQEIAGINRGNINPIAGVASMSTSPRRGFFTAPKQPEGTMATTRERHQIVETSTEARQAEPGPSVLALLTVSTGLAVLILGVVWFAFFRA